MGQRSNYAGKKDAQNKLRKGECAGGMVHIAIQTMNLLHSDQNTDTDSLLQPHPNLTSILLSPSSEFKEEGAFPEKSPYSVKKYTKFNVCTKVQLYIRSHRLHY